MNKKSFIIVGIVLLLLLGVLGICGCVAGGLLYRRSLAKARYSAGREFGRTTDQAGCLEESLRWISEDTPNTFIERFKKTQTANFTQGCLQTCKATKEFCSYVPRPEEWGPMLDYVNRVCRSSHHPGCTGVYYAIMSECGRTPPTVVSYPK